MLLIDNVDAVHINEAARALLKVLWKTNYAGNMRKLIPVMARQLDNGHLSATGVKLTQKIG